MNNADRWVSTSSEWVENICRRGVLLLGWRSSVGDYLSNWVSLNFYNLNFDSLMFASFQSQLTFAIGVEVKDGHPHDPHKANHDGVDIKPVITAMATLFPSFQRYDELITFPPPFCLFLCVDRHTCTELAFSAIFSFKDSLLNRPLAFLFSSSDVWLIRTFIRPHLWASRRRISNI